MSDCCQQITMVQNAPAASLTQNNSTVSMNSNQSVVSMSASLQNVSFSERDFDIRKMCYSPFPVVDTGYLLYEDNISKIILEDGSGFLKLEN